MTLQRMRVVVAFMMCRLPYVEQTVYAIECKSQQAIALHTHAYTGSGVQADLRELLRCSSGNKIGLGRVPRHCKGGALMQ